jgi:hypothetical protein
MVPLELQAGHPASRYRLSLAQCPSLASSRFALNTALTHRADISGRHTLAEATQNETENETRVRQCGNLHYSDTFRDFHFLSSFIRRFRWDM